MFRQKKMLIIFFASLFLIISTGVVGAQSNAFQNLLKKNEKVIQSDIKKSSTNELFNEIDDISNAMGGTDDINVLIPYVSELLDRKDSINDSKLINIIKEDKRTDLLRETAVDLYIVKHEGQPLSKALIDILKDSKTDQNIKSRIVAAASFTQNDVSLLKEMIVEDDGLLAFHSLKALSKINSDEAFDISEQILLDYENVSKDQLSSALYATSTYLRNSTLKGEKYVQQESDFLDLSFQLIDSEIDSYIKDSAFFAVSNLQSKEGIKRIVKSDSVDRELKVFSIDQNFITLKEMLLDKPTEEDVVLVVTAMELYPIYDLLEPLKKVSDSVHNAKLQNRINHVIELIEVSGMKGTNKWYE